MTGTQMARCRQRGTSGTPSRYFCRLHGLSCFLCHQAPCWSKNLPAMFCLVSEPKLACRRILAFSLAISLGSRQKNQETSIVMETKPSSHSAQNPQCLISWCPFQLTSFGYPFWSAQMFSPLMLIHWSVSLFPLSSVRSSWNSFLDLLSLVLHLRSRQT